MLGEALKGLGAKIDYLALRRHEDGPDGPGLHLWDGSAKGLRQAIRRLGTEVLWIQYSGYGFSRKGIPFGLARALEEVRKRPAAPTIVVCVHETHANRTRLGWRAPLIQRLQIVASRRVVRAADIVFATVDVNLNRCIDEYEVTRTSISLLPIASNIPNVQVRESERVAFRGQLGLPANARIAVMFGLWATQLRTLELFRDELISSLRDGRIDHVLAIGGEAKQPPKNLLKVGGKHLRGHLTVYGPASGPEIAKILRCCDIGLVPTPRDYLRKSGVAAAFVTADLELWMKNARSEFSVVKNLAPFPQWAELAGMASERIISYIKNSGNVGR
ncbi:MAG: hypothetical protein BMS9Abin05_1235 [Rhodothermia bacterium]|nr:MAG: hypothetical protein BMS9Abin05_1235 [Rhodothermia bacterium]